MLMNLPRYICADQMEMEMDMDLEGIETNTQIQNATNIFIHNNFAPHQTLHVKSIRFDSIVIKFAHELHAHIHASTSSSYILISSTEIRVCVSLQM